MKYRWLELSEHIASALKLVAQIMKEIPHVRKEFRLIVDQIYLIGLQSLPLIFVTAISTGMVMALQFGNGLARFGGIPYVPRLVTVSILREMGPVFTSLMLAARVGAGLAAEIGSQVVTQQIDAYWALGSSPIRKVVLPRIIALFVAVPILCAFSNIISILGVYIISVFQLNLDGPYTLSKIGDGFTLENFSSGFFKTFFFALIIGLSSCYFSLRVSEGTREVGIATTKAVVTASVLILVGDFLLTKLFLLL
ncbi:MAG: ABC transporter permease [Bdellovibrionaceae bacterium]|nr:ABC transporter permease [Pseudobdellovibrionaceae bacterium]MDW8190555.1 ABC transporter permease [Pseudobdellovibrionaceae bacterium]